MSTLRPQAPIRPSPKKRKAPAQQDEIVFDGASLVVDGRLAMAEVHEILYVAGQALEFDVAIALSVDGGFITSVKTYREGSNEA